MKPEDWDAIIARLKSGDTPLPEIEDQDARNVLMNLPLGPYDAPPATMLEVVSGSVLEELDGCLSIVNSLREQANQRDKTTQAVIYRMLGFLSLTNCRLIFEIERLRREVASLKQ